jgi:hypothetical protein
VQNEKSGRRFFRKEEMNMLQHENLLFVAGGLNFLLAIFHLFFWKIFRWREELPRISPANRAVIQILNFCITFLLFLQAYLLFFYAPEMVRTKLGQVLLISFAAFWFFRALLQPVFFGAKKPVSIGFTVFFLFMGGLYTAAL